MTRYAPIAQALVFVTASIMFGGASSAGIYANAAIELMAAVGIAFAIVTHARYPGELQRNLLLVLIAALALVVVQIIPLPPVVWTSLPGREVMVETLAKAGIPLGWRTLSMKPDATIGAGLAMLPVFAAALIGMRASRGALIALFVTLTIMMIGSVIVGLMQKVGGSTSSLYFYEISNRDAAVGFFANSNHFSTLCAISIPVATGVFVAQRGSTRLNARWLFLAGILLFALIGIWAAGSEAGLGLAAAGLVSVYAIARLHRGSKTMRYTIIGVAALGLLTIATILFALGMSDSTGGLSAIGGMGRATLWNRTITAIMATMPVGTGLGSFTTVYPQFENPMNVTDVFANHAHNDYLEVLMTGGIPALALLVAFAAWWLRASLLVWRAATRDAFSEAATVVTAIVILHEVVDYPIRTAAIGVIFGLCCGIMARPRRIVEPSAKLRERVGRHVAA